METPQASQTLLPATPARRRREAVRRLARAWRTVWEQAPPEDVERLARHAEALLREEPSPTEDTAEADLVRALTGDAPARDERVALEREAQERYFASRYALLEGALTTTQVAALLHTTRQTPHDRVRSGALLAVDDRSGLRFPPWQFDPQGPGGVLAGLPDILRALAGPPLAKAAWLTRPNPALDGTTPLQALRDGAREDVLSVAGGVGVN